jgi:hypothetical protein
VTIPNHFLAGSLIALAIPSPIIAVCLAFLSHFAMDALPHFGYAGQKGYSEALKHKLSYIVATVSFVLVVLVAIILIVTSSWFALAVGLVAISPDIIGLWNYLAFEKKGNTGNNILTKLHIQYHRKIQWRERPWGIYIELAVFILLFFLLVDHA